MILRILPLVCEITSSQNVNSSKNATGSVDYDSGPYNVTFPAGDISIAFDININDDYVLEHDEDFTLIISSLPGKVSRGDVSQATVAIEDDDGKV